MKLDGTVGCSAISGRKFASFYPEARFSWRRRRPPQAWPQDILITITLSCSVFHPVPITEESTAEASRHLRQNEISHVAGKHGQHSMGTYPSDTFLEGYYGKKIKGIRRTGWITRCIPVIHQTGTMEDEAMLKEIEESRWIGLRVEIFRDSRGFSKLLKVSRKFQGDNGDFSKFAILFIF